MILLEKITSIQPKGCSVIDYIAVSRKIQTNVNYFKVLDFTSYSDHKPISMELKCDHITVTQSQPLEVLYQPAPTRFIFNEENKTQFNESLTSEHAKQTLESLGNEIVALQVNQTQDKKLITDSIKDINNKFTEHLRNNSEKKQDNNPWFNWQTRLAKRMLRRSLINSICLILPDK